MKKMFIACFTTLVALCAFSVCVFAFSGTDTVSRTSTKTQTYSSGSIKLTNFYDYGTFLPNDDARLSASAVGSQTNQTQLHYKPYDSGNWASVYGTTTSGSIASTKGVNVSGVDTLQGGSYALSTVYTGSITLNVVD